MYISIAVVHQPAVEYLQKVFHPEGTQDSCLRRNDNGDKERARAFNTLWLYVFVLWLSGGCSRYLEFDFFQIGTDNQFRFGDRLHIFGG
jgi:hypothetical protein